ncbi:MAG: hypothetical protein H7039_15000 [Bryobacteraceae bacterium]|nr:hypothetical protein [Bryobacteraceae bacterium]
MIMPKWFAAVVGRSPASSKLEIPGQFLVVFLIGITLPVFYPVNTLSAGLSGFWLFDNVGSAVIPDVSGNGNDLSLTSTARVVSGGRFGKCLLLSNSSTVNDNAAVDSSNRVKVNFETGDFSVQVWAKFDDFSRPQTLIEKFDGASGPGWSVTVLNEHRLQFYGGAAWKGKRILSPERGTRWS